MTDSGRKRPLSLFNRNNGDPFIGSTIQAGHMRWLGLMTLRARRQIWRGELEMGSPFISTGFRDFVFRICHNSPTFELRGDWCLHDPLRTETEERLDGFFLDTVC